MKQVNFLFALNRNRKTRHQIENQFLEDSSAAFLYLNLYKAWILFWSVRYKFHVCLQSNSPVTTYQMSQRCIYCSALVPSSGDPLHSIFLFTTLLVLFTILNHWVAGSQVLSLPRHLHRLVTIVLPSEPMSKHTLEPLHVSLVAICILDSDIKSHLDWESLQMIPSFACSPSPSAFRHIKVPFNARVCWSV